MPNIGVPADLFIAGMSADAKNMLQLEAIRAGVFERALKLCAWTMKRKWCSRSNLQQGTERNAVAAERALVGCIIIVGEMMIDASCLYASLD